PRLGRSVLLPLAFPKLMAYLPPRAPIGVGLGMTMLIALHALAAVIWVGGMFFAYMVLRPASGPLDPASRLALWHRVFSRFFPWVWASIAVLLVSGYWMLFVHFGGFGK